jgi:hypothetical protein
MRDAEKRVARCELRVKEWKFGYSNAQPAPRNAEHEASKIRDPKSKI